MFSKKSKPLVRTVRSTQQPANIHLRSDIGCGVVGCKSCMAAGFSGYQPNLLTTLPVLIPDTNVVLHNINALEDSRVSNILFLGTVLSETMNRNRAVYAKIQRMIGDPTKHCYVFPNDRHEQTYCIPKTSEETGAALETPNEYNDRCIRVASMWLGQHIHTHIVNAEASCDAKWTSPLVALVSHDNALRESFAAEVESVGLQQVAPNLKCMTLREFALQIVDCESDLLEKLQYSVPAGMKEGPTASGGRIYDPHCSQSALEQGVSDGVFIKGKLRVSETNCFFGEIRGKWSGKPFDRVLVPGRKNLNRSIHDDIVAVELFPVTEWKRPGRKDDTPCPSEWTEEDALRNGCTPCGKVVGILELRRRPYCGSIDVTEVEKSTGSSGSLSVLVQPKNNRIPKIRIHTSQVEDLKDKRLSIVIDEWSEYSAYPNGHYIEVLGKIGDKDTEAIVILKENDVPHYDFSQAVYDCLPKGQWRVEESEVKKRLDLRDLCIVSVDPLGCRDIDDALHCRRVNGNHFEVGVHIADVTHFLHEHTPMDEEAAKRCTSVYLVDRRINMLPQLLTENLCSIVGGEDRYAFSIMWEFDENFNIVRDWYGKTVIRSRAALYYGDAQKMIDDPADDSEIAVSLKNLMRLSKHFKAIREKDGALFLASQEFKFKVDNDHVNPTDMLAYQTFEANSMIEEWMLFANAAAAKKIYSVYPRWTLLRRHQRPAEGAFDSINEALHRKIGVKLDDTTSLTLNLSLDRCVDPSDSFFNKLIRMLATRCLKQAQYFSSGEVPYDEFNHFGLAMPIYTHFTSPIRRFADVVVHRQLAAALGIFGVSEDHTNVEKMNQIAETINYRHEQAQKAGRDSQNLFTGFYLRNFANGEVPLEDGYVVKISDTHVFVLVPKYGQEGRIARETLIRDPQLLDKVKVRVIVRQEGDILRTKLEFRILGNTTLDTDEDLAIEEPAGKKLREE